MTLNVQYQLKNQPYCLNYIREHSIWYKYLNRNPERFKELDELAKEYYKLRASDKISKVFETFELITNVVSSLK